jgi:peptidyl-prolyl cis-trans isomerase B (cyclophilin B)
VIEGLRTLAPAGKQPVVASAAIALAEAAASSPTISPITGGWIECLAQAITIRAADSPHLDALASCGHGKLPDHLRLPIVASAIEAKVGTLDARRKAFAALVSHADARVKAAALGVIATLAGGEPDNRALVGTMVTALASPDPIVAGSAVDALPALYDAVGTESRGVLDGAVVARAATETDPELAASILQLIGKRAIASGVDACRAGLTGHVVRARAAVECLQALGEPSSAKPAAPIVPPVDVATVIGASLFWHLTTSQGEIVIALRPDVAPWAVATIVTLTRKGFYDGLEFHRVVPDFVVQGGDPTQSGWGGPGFTTPAEPATSLYTPGYITGGVGIADAGRDSGGSQWFIMHSRAAHLDARYTWIGSVESGQKYADALQIGDKVVRAVVEVR